jgi:ribonucleoside-diphosphate reductase alpha chain
MYTDPGSRLLRDVVFLRTYAETLPNGKKETIEQTVERVISMHVTKFPHLESEIREAFAQVHAGRSVPSMRCMQFAGYAVSRSEARVFNCSYVPIEAFKDVADTAWLSMNGTGVGFSVQQRHISKLPVISCHDVNEVYSIPDTKEGWADSILALLSNHKAQFDYSKVRKKGELLSTGGTASGPESLQELHGHVRLILQNADGRQLKPLEVHDILCHIGELVRCGGVRRTALISLFDHDNEEMLTCKHGEWYVNNKQRQSSNNSAVIDRRDPNYPTHIRKVLKRCFDSQCGEPGIYVTNDLDIGVNPCAEISLRPRQMCNLSEVNVAACQTEEEFYAAVKSAAIIGTLQASYTNFNYIDPRWKQTCDEDALLGVSLTGQSMNQKLLTADTLRIAAEITKSTNEEWAKKLGINPAARIGCVKPSGTTSVLLGTTSGIHAAHAEYYLRRVRIDTDNPVGKYLANKFGVAEPTTNSIVERDARSSHQIILSVPVANPGAITKDVESSIDLLERVKHIHQHWIKTSHRHGPNTHNVSVTVEYKQHEIPTIADWMVDNAEVYSGVSFFPRFDSTFVQAPLEAITQEQYNEWVSKFPNDVDLYSIDFTGAEDTRKAEAACAGGACEIV